jgi:hypothetical protein
MPARQPAGRRRYEGQALLRVRILKAPAAKCFLRLHPSYNCFPEYRMNLPASAVMLIPALRKSAP